jgi:serine/threonine protein phosphatase PrpC
MTRSIGDVVAKSVGVTYEPEIKSFPLTSDDKFIVIGSDGLWDRIPNDEVTRIVANPFYAHKDADGAVNYLMKESVDRW